MSPTPFFLPLTPTYGSTPSTYPQGVWSAAPYPPSPGSTPPAHPASPAARRPRGLVFNLLGHPLDLTRQQVDIHAASIAELSASKLVCPAICWIACTINRICKLAPPACAPHAPRHPFDIGPQLGNPLLHPPTAYRHRECPHTPAASPPPGRGDQTVVEQLQHNPVPALVGGAIHLERIKD